MVLSSSLGEFKKHFKAKNRYIYKLFEFRNEKEIII